MQKGRIRDTRCFKYQGREYIASQCPNQRTMIMLPNSEIVFNDEVEYERMPPLIDEEEDSGEE